MKNAKATKYKNSDIKDILKIQDDEFEEYFKPVDKNKSKNEKRKKKRHNAKMQRDEKVYQLYLEGNSISQISRDLKMSRNTISSIVNSKSKDIIKVEDYQLNRKKYIEDRKVYAKFQRAFRLNKKENTFTSDELEELTLEEFNENEQKIILKYNKIRDDIYFNINIDFDKYEFGCLKNSYLREIEEEIHTKALPYCHEEICIALSPGKRIS